MECDPSSQVDLPHAMNFRAIRGANFATRWSRSPQNRGERTPRSPPFVVENPPKSQNSHDGNVDETWRYGESTDRCRANMAHIRQSRPDYGLGFQAKVRKTFKAVLSSLGSGGVGGEGRDLI
jgi:hypothetical protein